MLSTPTLDAMDALSPAPPSAPRARRVPAGAAALRPEVTAAITDAVLAELVERGYGGLTMEGVARRAGVGKSALYRRWPSRSDMVVSALSELSIPMAAVPDHGSLARDLAAALRAAQTWMTHPQVATVLPDLASHAAREPALADALRRLLGEPWRALGAAVLQRAVARGELDAGADLELALDLLAGPLYWRQSVRRVEADDGYHERLGQHVLRALGARPAAGDDAER